MNPTPTTRTARSDELDETIELCLAAFADEAVTAWLLPDPAERASHMRRTFTASLGTAVAAGTVILATGPDGTPVAASIWVPGTGGPRPAEAAMPPTAQEDPVARRLAAVQAATEARRPTAAHLHLSAMGTVPQHRGRGAGGAMIAAGLARARARGLPVYLEASTSDNRRLYERFGFRDHGEPIVLPHGGPSLQPMWLAHRETGAVPAPG